ncbi:unnamed protein product [Durusdinium trenchii]|uniref:Uncharacterized protein n=1 Tax=Durusdinium trenchii TaxID=1381693 RepID=A0ABP0SR09_9DINO
MRVDIIGCTRANTVGVDSLTIPLETDFAPYSHILFFMASYLQEQSTPFSYLLPDEDGRVTDLVFIDQDLDHEELGGAVTWTPPPVLTENIVAYRVVFSQDTMGVVDRRDIVEEPGTALSSTIPENTAILQSTYLAVFTRSSSTEGSTPTAIELVDSAVNVSNVSFVDYDLDDDHIAGVLTYDPPEDTSVVTHFVLYLARQVNGIFERAPYAFNVSYDNLQEATSFATSTQVGEDWNETNATSSTTTGTSTTSSSTTSTTTVASISDTQRLEIPCDTELLGYTHMLIYCEQTYPVIVELDNAYSKVANISYFAEDLNLDNLEGSIEWDHPDEYSKVLVYQVKLQDAAGGSDLLLRANLVQESTNVTVQGLKHVVSLYQDVVSAYRVFIAMNQRGLDRISAAAEVSVGTSEVLVHTVSSLEEQTTPTWKNVSDTNFQVELPAETSIAPSDYLLLYAATALQEQTWPATRYIPDDSFDVRNLAFTDLDLDQDELGGVLSWTEHSYRYKVESYHVYLASDAAGTNRNRLTNATGEARFTTTFDVPADTAAVDSAGATATHFVVYQQTSLVEETTPAALAISDTGIQAQQVLFTDYDLDVNELGGNISWQQPSLDTSLISHYLVYFSLDNAGANRFHFTTVEQGTTTEVHVPADYVLVYAQSTWAEQTTPAYIKIADADMPVTNVVWVGEDTTHGIFLGVVKYCSECTALYAVYLADDAAGLNKQLVNWTGSLSGYNLTELEASGALSYIELGEALAEATTPSFLSFAGAADNASVKEVNLTDDAAW